jgi:hypothetical protein
MPGRTTRLTADPETIRAWHDRTARTALTPDPRETTARTAVWRRDAGRCQFPHTTPGTPQCDAWRGLDYQHRKRRSQCSPAEVWDPANGVLLCRASHAWVTGNPTAAAGLPVRVALWGHEPVTTPLRERA